LWTVPSAANESKSAGSTSTWTIIVPPSSLLMSKCPVNVGRKNRSGQRSWVRDVTAEAARERRRVYLLSIHPNNSDVWCWDRSRRAVDLPDPEPLPKASYATLKDKQLKDMLLEHKLPVTGERSVWNARHQR
jgi:hypothetical protein